MYNYNYFIIGHFTRSTSRERFIKTSSKSRVRYIRTDILYTYVYILLYENYNKNILCYVHAEPFPAIGEHRYVVNHITKKDGELTMYS
jgi:hypothetical protein